MWFGPGPAPSALLFGTVLPHLWGTKHLLYFLFSSPPLPKFVHMYLCECFINGSFVNLSNYTVEVLEGKDCVRIFIYLISLRTVTEIYLT